MPSWQQNKKTPGWKCLRCGRCCFEPFYRHVRPRDLSAWQHAGHLDIIRAYEEERKKTSHFNPAMAAVGKPLSSCRFLRAESENCFACAIYELRPQTCRQFQPGTSRLCPQYQAGPKVLPRPS